MSDYIKREDAYTAIHEQYPHLNDAGVHLVINTIPAADVVERKKGEWVVDDEFIDCSACREEKWSRVPFEDLVSRFRFCPNCGADMRGES